MVRFFIPLITLVFTISLKGEYTILIKMITYSHNTRVVFKLGIDRLYIFVIEVEEGRRFSLISIFLEY